MRRRFSWLRVWVLALSFGWSLTPSLADERLSPDREWGNVKGWQIFWNEARQACFAVAQYQDNTIFWIGLNRGGTDGFIAAANGRWVFVEQGKQYDIGFVFDGSRRWNGEMSGTSFGDRAALEVDGVKVEFLEDVARSSGLRLDRGKRKLTTLSLKGTRAALDGVTVCTRVAGAASGGDTVAGGGTGNDTSTGDDGDLAEAQRLNDKASQKHNARDYDGAEPLYRRALAIADKTLGPSHDETAVIIMNLSELLYAKGDYDGAIPLFRRGLAIKERSRGSNHLETAESLVDLAALLHEKSDYDGAEPLLRRALAIREKALGPAHSLTVKTLSDLASVLQNRGDYDGAMSLFRRALTIFEKSIGRHHHNTAAILIKLANLLKDKGDYDGAEPLYRRALAIDEKASGRNHPNTAASLNNLANLLKDKGDYDGAESLYRRALAIDEKASGPNHPDKAKSLNNLANLLRDKGDYDGAEPLYRRALAIFEKALGPDHPDTGSCLNNLAILLQNKRDFDGAEPLHRRALAIREKALGLTHPDTGQSLKNLAELLLEKGVPSEALDLFRRASAYGGASRKTYLNALQAFDPHSLELLSESFSVVQATSSSEAGYALASLSARFAVGDTDLAALVREEQDASIREVALDKLFLAEAGKPSGERNPKHEEALKAQIDETKARLASVRNRLAKDFPDYAELSRPKQLELEEAQKLLKDDEALIIIDTVKDGEGDYVWAVSSTGAAWHKLKTSDGEIDKLVSELLPKLNPDNQAEIDPKQSYRLFQLTLGEVGHQLTGKKHLIFVLNGAMTSLPPHVLVTSDPTGKGIKDVAWLIRDHAVTVLPTVSSLRLLRGSAPGPMAARPMRGYADITYAPGGAGGALEVASRSVGELFNGGMADTSVLQGASPLPATGPEARAVMQVLGGNEIDIVTGRTASETEIKKANLSDYRVLYFATHGLLAGEVEELAKVKAEPALLFAVPEKPTLEDDGLLTASEVAQLKLNADWAVLSACNTAAGGKPGAAALSGLARAFFYAGARSLLVSHWPVEDEATKALMVRLFEAVKANPDMRAAEAQQAAMLSVMKDPNHPQWANPAYWAPFILVGEPRSQL